MRLIIGWVTPVVWDGGDDVIKNISDIFFEVLFFDNSCKYAIKNYFGQTQSF